MTAMPAAVEFPRFQKDVTDPAIRLINLIDRIEPRLRARFTEAVVRIRDEHTLRSLADLIERGQANIAMEGIERAFAVFADEANDGLITAGRDTGEFLRGIGANVSFDQTNVRAVRVMQENRLRMISQFSDQQRRTVRQALLDGVARGLNPREQARAFRGAIGLTESQQRAVDNYRRLLETRDRKALERGLRDRRFDSTVRRAIRDDVPLTKEQLDRMVGRYRQRSINHRAEVIARTEALRAAHEGSAETYAQAIEQGELEAGQIVREWITARDERVRSSHAIMNGQTQGSNGVFISGNGNRLRFPGDPNAPASEIVMCRCVVTTRIRTDN